MAPSTPDLAAIEELWPYSKGQLDHLPIFLERFKAWKAMMDELILFFRELQHLEAGYAKQYSKAHRLFTPSRPQQLKMFEFAGDMLRPLFLDLQQISSEHSSMEHHIKDITLNGLLGIKAELIQRYKDFKTRVESLNMGIIKSRVNTLKSIKSHEKFLRKQTGTSHIHARTNRVGHAHTGSTASTRRHETPTDSSVGRSESTNVTAVKQSSTQQTPTDLSLHLDLPTESLSESMSNLATATSNGNQDESSTNGLTSPVILDPSVHDTTNTAKGSSSDVPSVATTDIPGESSNAGVYTVKSPVEAHPILLGIVNKTSPVDPWLQMRDLHAQLRRMIDTENEFQQRVIGILTEMEELDRRILDGMKVIVDQYIRKVGEMHDSSTDKLYDMGDIMLSVPSDAPYKAFRVRNDLTDDIYRQERRLADFPFQPPGVSIDFEGIVLRQKAFKRSWSTMVAVITESGWLHCFDSRFGNRSVEIGGVTVHPQSFYSTLTQNSTDSSSNLFDGSNGTPIDSNHDLNSRTPTTAVTESIPADSSVDANPPQAEKQQSRRSSAVSPSKSPVGSPVRSPSYTGSYDLNAGQNESFVSVLPTCQADIINKMGKKQLSSTSINGHNAERSESVENALFVSHSKEGSLSSTAKATDVLEPPSLPSKDVSRSNLVAAETPVTNGTKFGEETSSSVDRHGQQEDVDGTTLLLGGNNNKDIPVPKYSVFLCQPDVTIRVDGDKVHDNIFSVVVGGTKKGFKGNLVKKEEVYEFKTMTDADLLDWIAAIKHKIEEPSRIAAAALKHPDGYLPPPPQTIVNNIGESGTVFSYPLTELGTKPLFRTRQEFDEELEKRKKDLTWRTNRPLNIQYQLAAVYNGEHKESSGLSVKSSGSKSS